MSAIACKIIICSNQSNAVTNTTLNVIADLEDKPALARQIIKIQDKYVDEMNKAHELLTRD